ncbi:hypothetical protein, partial [Enterococcus plantarum]|uniref:hypothetical protein n=1 Tax=Enterococcus plantarum TaxID=1077675 RepID=UPI001A8FAF57
MRADDIDIQSHIYVNHQSIESSDLKKLLKKINFLIENLFTVAKIKKSGKQLINYFYFDKEIMYDKSAFKETLKRLPRDKKIQIFECLLRSPAVIKIPFGHQNYIIQENFFINSIFHSMNIKEIELNLKKCNFPGFYLFLEEQNYEYDSFSILEVDNFNQNIAQYNNLYLTSYLNRCSKVSKEIGKIKNIKKVRYDSKDASLFPHIHFFIGKDELVLNFIDKYFNHENFWKHDDNQNKKLP